MPIPRSLLDTDTLSAIMRRDPRVLPHAAAYLSAYQRFSFSILTRYEILRGLKAKSANKQLAAFEQFCVQCEVIPLDDASVVKAADIYAELHKRGEIIGDADLLIAAAALTHGLQVVTNNEDHFKRVHGLTVVNWLKA